MSITKEDLMREFHKERAKDIELDWEDFLLEKIFELDLELDLALDEAQYGENL